MGPAAAGDHAEHARRHTRPLGQLGHGQRRVGGGAGGLDHHGAAGGEGGADLAGDHGVGEVPGRDRGAHAHGLLEHQDPARGHGLRDDVAIDPLGFLGEPLEERGAVADLALGLGQGLALLAGHQEGEVVGVGHDQLEPLAQDGRPLLGGLRPPGGQGAVRGLDRAPRLGDADAGYRADHLAVGGVGDLDRPAVLGPDPRPVDIALLAKQALVGKLDARILECGRHGALVLMIDGAGRSLLHARNPDPNRSWEYSGGPTPGKPTGRVPRRCRQRGGKVLSDAHIGPLRGDRQ